MTSNIPVTELTEGTLDGGGVFDRLMRATKAHLDDELKGRRLTGPDYAQVYLGGLQSAMSQSIQFLLQREQSYQQAELLKAQVETQSQQTALVVEQTESEALRNQTGGVIEAEIARAEAETARVTQETDNLVASKAQTEAATLNLGAEKARIEAQTLNLGSEKAQIESQTDMIEKQALQVVQETANALAQKAVIDANADKVVADTALTEQQTLNAVTQELVLQGQKCKLDAEFDLLGEQRLKTVAETAVLNQKKVTEQAQTQGGGVSSSSVLGRQMSLYEAQANGYKRDAEQKVAKLLADTWNVRRTTDEGTQANTTNKLDDATVGRAISKMLSGVDA